VNQFEPERRAVVEKLAIMAQYFLYGKINENHPAVYFIVGPQNRRAFFDQQLEPLGSIHGISPGNSVRRLIAAALSPARFRCFTSP
jgi:hypothetical protein